MLNTDQYWMQHALALANRAWEMDEVPVGAVLVLDDVCIGEGWNQPISQLDPSAHAEIIALRQGARHIGNYRLNDTTLYVTLEPCAMCAGALVHARVKRLVCGTRDPKSGAAGSVLQLVNNPQLNHRMACTFDVCQSECQQLLKTFFQQRR